MLLTAEGLILLVLAVALAWPVPAALARAGWPARDPRAALVLWQAVGLGGGLAILGGGLTLAISGLHRSWLGGVTALPGRVLPGRVQPAAGHAAGLGWLGWSGAVLAAAAGGWLLAVFAASTGRLLLARREHRRRLDLLADAMPASDLLAGAAAASTGPVSTGTATAGSEGWPGQVELLDHPAATAYCLPGLRPRIVLSQGVIDALAPDQLAAVVTHERAHARGRHDLVIQPFRAWRQTFGFLHAARQAQQAVELLVEMLADDAARRQGPGPLAGALRALAAATPGDGQVTARARRLTAGPAPLPRLAAAAVYLAAAALICLPPAVLLVS